MPSSGLGCQQTDKSALYLAVKSGLLELKERGTKRIAEIGVPVKFIVLGVPIHSLGFLGSQE